MANLRILKDKYNLEPQFYLLLKYNKKPVIRIVSPPDIETLKSFCKKNNFYFLCTKPGKIFGNRIAKLQPIIYISRSDNLNYKAHKSEINNDQRLFGELMGYPECCIENYQQNVGRQHDINIYTYKNSSTNPSWYCNNIFVYYSKLNKEEGEIYAQNYFLFKKISNYFLIGHVPCSYKCRKSIEIGKIVYQLLKKEDTGFSDEIASLLKRPVLYFNYFNWLVFDGRVDGNSLIYNNLLPYKSLFPKEKIEIIKEGNNVRVTDKQIVFYRNQNIILKIPKKNKNNGVIINF